MSTFISALWPNSAKIFLWMIASLTTSQNWKEKTRAPKLLRYFYDEAFNDIYAAGSSKHKFVFPSSTLLRNSSLHTEWLRNMTLFMMQITSMSLSTCSTLLLNSTLFAQNWYWTTAGINFWRYQIGSEADFCMK